MKNKQNLSFLFIIFFSIITSPIFAQSWKFVKEKDGVKLYSRQEKGNTLHSFKGITTIPASIDKVLTLLEDVNNRDWWDKNIQQIKMLKYEKHKRSQYYLVYKMHWPFSNRDMYVEVRTTNNLQNGERKLTATPLVGAYPEIKNLVRIKNYKQQWTIKALNDNTTEVELEFYVDPAEKLPNWLLNMVLTDTPINSINGLKAQLKNN